MSAFAGVYQLDRGRTLSTSIIEKLRRGFATPDELTRSYRSGQFAVFKFDFGAFDGIGYLENGDAVALVAGEPLMAPTKAATPSREDDLRTLQAELKIGNLGILTHCQGTFAGCFYDSHKHSLLLATDKLGSRPVYFWQGDEHLYFSSFLKTFERMEVIPKRLDMTAFCEQFVFGAPLGTKTLYEDIKILRDGQYLQLDSARCTISEYFQWQKVEAHQRSGQQQAELCYEAFTEAVRCRSMASETAHSFLSGGLDSRCIVAALHDQGKKITAFNLSEPGDQDALFAKQYADLINIEYVSARRSATFDGSTKALFQDAVTKLRAAAGSSRWSKRIFSGDGGSVGMGFVYLDARIMDLMKSGAVDDSIRHFLRQSGTIPLRILNKKIADEYGDVLAQGMRTELEELRECSPEHRIFLFLLRNDQRCHLHGFYELLDELRVELILPFFDGRLLQAVVSAADLRPMLLHRFYHEWLKCFPATTYAVPWQTYPGHLTCPVSADDRAVNQWKHVKDTVWTREAPWFDRCRRVSLKGGLSKRYIRSEQVWMSLLLHGLRFRNYGYVFRFCVKLAELQPLCTDG
jgi:asparagine synthase (glutamine-hydrolysing)